MSHHSQSVITAIGVLTFLLLAMLPPTLSAFRLDEVRREPDSYPGIDIDRVNRQSEWRRNIPLLVKLLRSIYVWERDAPNVDESAETKSPSSSFRSSSSLQEEDALVEMLASISNSLHDVKPNKATSQEERTELTPSEEADDDDDETLMTSKRRMGDVYGVMPPLKELCRMMGWQRCN